MLSIVTVPGKATVPDPIAPGLIAEPADFITKLIGDVEPEVIVNAPETMVDAFVPLVVS